MAVGLERGLEVALVDDPKVRNGWNRTGSSVLPGYAALPRLPSEASNSRGDTSVEARVPRHTLVLLRFSPGVETTEDSSGRERLSFWLAGMWETEESEVHPGLILIVGVVLFVLLGVIALALRLSVVDAVLLLSIGVTFLIIFLYGWFITRDETD